MRLLAGQAAILLANSQSLREARRLSRRLTEALASRDTVARATGVLLAQGATGEEEAFTTLAAAARQADRPVQDVARALVTAVTTRNSRRASA
jgi:AmiR/NasT family two-component response regulator